MGKNLKKLGHGELEEVVAITHLYKSRVSQLILALSKKKLDRRIWNV